MGSVYVTPSMSESFEEAAEELSSLCSSLLAFDTLPCLIDENMAGGKPDEPDEYE